MYYISITNFGLKRVTEFRLQYSILIFSYYKTEKSDKQSSNCDVHEGFNQATNSSGPSDISLTKKARMSNDVGRRMDNAWYGSH